MATYQKLSPKFLVILAIFTLILTTQSRILQEPTNDLTKDIIPNPNEPEITINKVTCPSIGYFTGIKTTEHRDLVKNKSNMCTFIEDTCCTDSDFLAIKSWWEDKLPNEDRSRFTIKTERLTKLAVFTNDLLSQNSTLATTAKEIESKQEKYNGPCLSSAQNFLSSEAKNFDKYLNLAETCWEAINDLQNGIMCMACDPRAQTMLDFQKGKLVFGPKAAEKFSKSCSGLAWLFQKEILPYFERVNS